MEAGRHSIFWGGKRLPTPSGERVAEVTAAEYKHIMGQQVDVMLEANLTSGKLLSFIETHSRVRSRHYVDSRVRIKATMGKQTLADLSRNPHVEIQHVGQAE